MDLAEWFAEFFNVCVPLGLAGARYWTPDGRPSDLGIENVCHFIYMRVDPAEDLGRFKIALPEGTYRRLLAARTAATSPPSAVSATAFTTAPSGRRLRFAKLRQRFVARVSALNSPFAGEAQCHTVFGMEGEKATNC